MRCFSKAFLMPASLMVFLLAFPSGTTGTGTAAAENGLSFADIPEIPNSEPFERRVMDAEHLIAEHHIVLEPGTSYEETGRKAVAESERFLELMKQAGWSLIRESRQRRGGEFTFRREIIKEIRALIGTKSMPRNGTMRPCVILRLEYSRRIPFQDILGRDPVDVPRYPGSIRVRWMHLLGDFAAKYLVVDDVHKVRSFFVRELENQGWRPSRKAAGLNYVKGSVRSPESMPRETPPPTEPAGRIASMIPATLSISAVENEGIVEIGVGRSAGSADRGRPCGELEMETTPLAPEPLPQDGKIVVALDIENELPVYGGLTLVSREDLPVNYRGEDTIRLKYEIADAPMEAALAVAEFYKNKLSADGWESLGEEWFGIGRTLDARKDAVRLRVSVKAVGRYPIPEHAPRIRIPVEIDVVFALPRKETAGEDIDGVTIFPGSVRFFFLKTGIDHIVKYKAVTRRETAEQFFVDTLPRSGWRFAGNDKTGLLFIPAGNADTAAGAHASAGIIPTTLKIKVDHFKDQTVMIGLDLTRGDGS